MKILLIGMRGAGKTTVGQHLARRRKLPFVDTDALIEERIGASISRIFLEQGEMAFREYETSALREIQMEKDAVVATGGGILLRPENQVLLPRMGKVVYLFARPELLRKRLAHSKKRPALTGLPVEEEVEFLFLTRDPLYRDAADLVLPVAGLGPEQVCERIEAGLAGIKKRLPKSRKKG